MGLCVDRVCGVAGCEWEYDRAGYCSRHYRRWWRYGDPLKGGPFRESHTPTAVEDFPDGTRKCTECGERKPLADAFHRDEKATSGYRSKCKPCRGKSVAVWYAATADQFRDRRREAYQRDIEQIRQRDRERYERDREHRIELATSVGHARRARLRGQESERGLSVAFLRKRDGDHCCYCGTVLAFVRIARNSGLERPDNQATLEHILPISRGGSHTSDNVSLACWRCNISKGMKTLDEWGGPDERYRSADPKSGMYTLF